MCICISPARQLIWRIGRLYACVDYMACVCYWLYMLFFLLQAAVFLPCIGSVAFCLPLWYRYYFANPDRILSSEHSHWYVLYGTVHAIRLHHKKSLHLCSEWPCGSGKPNFGVWRIEFRLIGCILSCGTILTTNLSSFKSMHIVICNATWLHKWFIYYFHFYPRVCWARVHLHVCIMSCESG